MAVQLAPNALLPDADQAPLNRLNPLLPPPGVADERLWMIGWRQRRIHLPQTDKPDCPVCAQKWPCQLYKQAIRYLAVATVCRPPATTAVGIYRVPAGMLLGPPLLGEFLVGDSRGRRPRNGPG